MPPFPCRQRFLLIALLALIGMAALNPHAWSGEPSPKAKAADKKARRVFVLHSGIHTIIANPSINISAERLEKGLLARGVAAEDIVLMANPFPKATWKSMFPKEALEMYLDSLSPSSKIVQDAYLRMHKGLQDKKVGPEDEVVWVGHSAGGQLGMTVTHLAHTLGKHPDFAKLVPPYRITTVITLGTPVGANLLPEDVQLRNYFSAGDDVVHLATKSAWITSVTFGFKGKLQPCSTVLSDNWRVRVYEDIQHNVWTKEERIIDRIAAEFGPPPCPCWHSALCPRPGLSLSHLFCHALDQELHISYEDPPKLRTR